MEATTKVCIKCQERLPISSFSKDAKNKDGTRNVCKSCASAHDAKNRQASKAWIKETFKDRWFCKKCGDTRSYLMEAHHIDPSGKDFAISEKVFISDAQKQKCIEEFNKCVILCCNCHREYHYLSRQAALEGNTLTTEQYIEHHNPVFPVNWVIRLLKKLGIYHKIVPVV